MNQVCRAVLLLLMVPALLRADGPSRSMHFEGGLRLLGDELGLSPRVDSTALAPMLTAVPAAKKNVGLAAIYSLLLPGMGELYAGDFSIGRYFLIAEGGLWLAYATFDVYGNAVQSDARSFAALHAGFSQAGKDDQFFIDVGNFSDVNDYNEKKLRDREPLKVYDPAAGYTWNWETDGMRLHYRDERVHSENLFNDRRFVIAAVLINHVASAINAARVAIAHNKALASTWDDVHVGARVLGGWESPHGVLVTVSKSF